MLREEMAKIIKVRQREVDNPHFEEIWDNPEIFSLLKRDYNETMKFLKTATFDEIGIASSVLEDLIEIFSTQELLDCFKSRVDEFAKHDAEENFDKPSIIMNVFKESVDEAEEYLQELIKSKN